MKWIYNDYEFDNRINNLAWTISGNYSDKIDVLEKDYSSKEVSLYFGIIAGARIKYIDWDIVKKYLLNRMKKGYDKNSIINLVQIILNSIVESKVIEDRPGVYEIRANAYKDIVNGFTKIYKDDVLQKVKFALILESMGKHPSTDRFTKRIINDIKNINLNKDIKEILIEIDKIYFKHFEKNIQDYNLDETNKDMNNKDIDINFDTFSDFMYEELYSEEEDKFVENQINSMSSSMLVESVGESINDNNSANRVIYVDEETANKIYEKIEYYYGKTYLTQSEIVKIESKNCRNAHEGCRIHFTDGVLRSECENIFQVKYVTRHKENNIKKYRDNIKVYKRNINKLKESISRILIEENEKNRIYSDYGTVYANKVWRVGRSNNNKIFYRDIYNERGRYVIDILLDSSGSQSRNQYRVAIQAYIIASALTLAGIPNRVIGFSSFLDYTILKRFRDYKDSVNVNENIFEYFCAGNNRDGLAIKSVCEGLLDREEENKILIVLSDGKPNDVKIGSTKERSIRSEVAYKGQVAIKDTASEVRNARKKGILVLGVFTGKENELVAEKLIYGKDFIYTKDIERFSDIVSIYLKKIIRN
ncbi:MAG: nitric oxide reductase activation-like protein [Peptostreptococcaceae bacterium]